MHYFNFDKVRACWEPKFVYFKFSLAVSVFQFAKHAFGLFIWIQINTLPD